MSKLGKKRHKHHFWKSLSHKKTKSCIVLSYPLNIRQNVKWGTKNGQGAPDYIFSERESSFSLEIRAIRPSAVFGTRREAALRGESFAWVLNLGSFLKLREVGVSPYLDFILRLSVITMFALNEAVRGRLIGSKAWNRGGKI